MLAYLEAMADRTDEARDLYGRSRAIYEELGMTFALVARTAIPAAIETMAGNPAGAERELLSGYEALATIGETELRSTVAAMLAESYVSEGRDDEAEQWLERGRETPSDERLPQMLWRQVRGKVLARRGELEEGERLAREAVALAEESDMLNAHADALLDLAEVLTLASQDARPELDRALALYERKGNLVMVERTRSKLAELTALR